MAQKEGFQAEAPIPCVNNCGFFGSVATMNFCSTCFRNSASSASASSRLVEIQISSSGSEQIPVMINTGKAPRGRPASSASWPSSSPDLSRCHWCRKRIGLSTGFKCRCGDTFCSTHRYSDEHQCSFDYKAAGRASIAKANPLVIASKINKI